MRKISLYVISSLLFLCFTQLVFADQVNRNTSQVTWQSIGPYGAATSTVTIDPSNAAILYLGTEDVSTTGPEGGKGIFKSSDGGNSWTSLALTGYSIYDISVNPLNPEIVYSCAAEISTDSAGVYKSVDHGLTWLKVFTNQMYTLAINPTNPNIIYAGGYQGLYMSEDAGRNWNNIIPQGDPYVDPVTQVIVHPVQTTTLFVATAGGVFKSTDAGKSWQDLHLGADATITIDTKHPNTIFIGGSELFKSTNLGVTWQPTGLRNVHIRSLAVDPNNSLIVYAATAEGLYVSKDAGKTWKQQNQNLPKNDIKKIIVNPTTSYIYTLINNLGIFQSHNEGLTWIDSNKGLSAYSIAAIGVGIDNPAILYAGSEEGGAFKTKDEGATWQRIGLEGGFVRTFAIDPFNSEILLAGIRGKPWGLEDGIYKSSDGGNHWHITNFKDMTPRAVVFDPHNPAIAYAGRAANKIETGGVYKSVDFGETWQFIGLEDIEVKRIAIDPLVSNVMYAGYADVYKSTDAGKTWQKLGNNFWPGSWSIVIYPFKTNLIYLGGHNTGIFKSVDGGINWNNMGINNQIIRGIAFDLSHPDTLYAGAEEGGIFKSTNAGSSWGEANDGLTNKNILVMARGNNNHIYAGTQGGGIFKLVP